MSDVLENVVEEVVENGADVAVEVAKEVPKKVFTAAQGALLAVAGFAGGVAAKLGYDKLKTAITSKKLSAEDQEFMDDIDDELYDDDDVFTEVKYVDKTDEKK